MKFNNLNETGSDTNPEKAEKLMEMSVKDIKNNTSRLSEFFRYLPELDECKYQSFAEIQFSDGTRILYYKDDGIYWRRESYKGYFRSRDEMKLDDDPEKVSKNFSSELAPECYVVLKVNGKSSSYSI